jgi:hypothetical protein
LAVSSSVLLLLLGAVTLVFQTVLAYHRRTDAQIDLERSLLLTLKTLSRECSESSWTSFEVEADGFVFSTPRDEAGTFLVGPDDEPAWASLVCYSRQTQGATDVLVKRVETFATPMNTIPEPLTFSPARDVAWFGSSSIQPRVLQRNVEHFVVSRENVGDEDGTDVLKVEIGASVGPADGAENFSLELSTSIRPRN